MTVRQYLSSRAGAASLSIASNTILIALKIVIGLLTGSVSVISEAIHSTTDLLAAVIAFFAIRSAARPADADHPYGHAKYESLAAIVEALLIVAAAGLIVYEAARRLYSGTVIVNVDWAIAVMLFAATTNFIVSRHLFRVARRTESPALAADAWHLSTDLYTALGVVVGLLLVRITGLPYFDPLVALGVAFFIVKAAWDIGRGAVADLLDESLPAKDEATIRAILDAHRALFSTVRTMRTRRAGGRRHAYIALEFPPTVSLSDAHVVAEHLEGEIKSAFPKATVVVEAEPTTSAETAETITEMVERIARRLGAAVHHISVYAAPERFNVTLHLEVEAALSLAEAHALATRLEDELRREIPRIARVDTHIEPMTRNALEEEKQARDQARVQRTLQILAQQMPHVRGVHDVQVHRHNSTLSVSLHCALDGSVSIAQAHQLSDEIEERLKQQLPEVSSVLIHTEPYEAQV